MPSALRISHTVQATTVPARVTSSPWIRRYPQDGFSRARRRTRVRMERMVGGRPRRFGVEMVARLCFIRLRCQRSTVSARTTRRGRRKTGRGRGCNSAASNARSAGVKVTVLGPSWRCSTASWWRRVRISAPLARWLHWQQPQDSEDVGDGQIGQAKQHPTIMTAGYVRPGWLAEPHAPRPPPHCTLPVTSTDEIFGRHRVEESAPSGGGGHAGSLGGQGFPPGR